MTISGIFTINSLSANTEYVIIITYSTILTNRQAKTYTIILKVTKKYIRKIRKLPSLAHFKIIRAKVNSKTEY
jgi:hypothetical protein